MQGQGQRHSLCTIRYDSCECKRTIWDGGHAKNITSDIFVKLNGHPIHVCFEGKLGQLSCVALVPGDIARLFTLGTGVRQYESSNKIFLTLEQAYVRRTAVLQGRTGWGCSRVAPGRQRVRRGRLL